MKSLLLIALTLLSVPAISATALDIAYEMDAFKAEYSQASKKGSITPLGCNQCDTNVYYFDNNVKILKSEQEISVNEFITDYWNAQYPTIFLNPKTKLIILIAY